MIVTAHQPQFLPWIGYFDKMDRADVFVLLDTVQFKKNEWQNRNRIKTAQGWQWLTVPVRHDFGQSIHEVEIAADVAWQDKHLKSLQTNYRKAAFFEAYFDTLAEIYQRPWTRLAALNIAFIRALSQKLGLTTEIVVSSELPTFSDHPDDRLIELTRHFNADTYLAGAGGRAYMDVERYDRAGINLVFQDFVHPTYAQLYGEFIPGMSVVDLLFNCGETSLEVIRNAHVHEESP